MRITRRQLRRIIKEVDEYEDIYKKWKEAVYVIMYIKEYVQVYMEDLYNVIHRMAREAAPDDPLVRLNRPDDYKPIDVLTKLTNQFNGVIVDMFNNQPALERYMDSARYDDGIVGEAEGTAQTDFLESVYKPIEEINRFMTQGTPIGMSVLDALNEPGVGIPSTKAGLIQTTLDSLMALMDDDQVLAIFDQLDVR